MGAQVLDVPRHIRNFRRDLCGKPTEPIKTSLNAVNPGRRVLRHSLMCYGQPADVDVAGASHWPPH